jgi:hypothetical protein
MLLLRRIGDQWLMEHPRNRLPGDMEQRFNTGGPVIENQDP